MVRVPGTRTSAGPIAALSAELQGNVCRRAFGASTLLQLAAGKRQKQKARCVAVQNYELGVCRAHSAPILSALHLSFAQDATFGSVHSAALQQPFAIEASANRCV